MNGSLLAALNDPALVFDPELLVRQTNAAFLATLGFDPVGLHLDELMRRVSCRTPDGGPVRVEDKPTPRALRGEYVARRRFLVTRGDGTDMMVETSSGPVRGGERVLGSVTVWHDVTAREQATAALRDSEQRYRELFEAMQEGFAVHEIVCDASGNPVDYRFLEVNPAFERLTGLPRDRVVGRLVSEILPDDYRSWVEAYGPVALTGATTHFERWAPALQRWYQVVAYRPRPGCFATLFTDVTMRRRTDEALRKSEQRLASFIEHSPAGLAMFDRQMRCLAASKRFASDLRVSSEDLVGRSYYDVFPETPERWRRAHQRCLAGAVERCDTDPFHRADGTVDWVTWDMRPWRDSAGEIGGVVLYCEVTTGKDPLPPSPGGPPAATKPTLPCSRCGRSFEVGDTGAAYVLLSRSATQISEIEVCPACSPYLAAALFPNRKGGGAEG